MASSSKLWTIGYEGAAVHGVVSSLADAGVELLVDVRIRAQSRKPGFSKSTLASELARADIDYEHLRDLGTPLEIRARFRAGEIAPARDEYRAYLREDPAAMLALQRLVDLVVERRVALLCFERDVRDCHRFVICEELAGSLPSLECVHMRP